MRGIIAFVTGLSVIPGLSSEAFAADVAAHPPVISAGAVMPDETGAGWYLRGDVGFSRNVAPTMDWQSTSFSNITAANAGTFDFGAGYRFTENLRSDLTLDFLTDHSIKGDLNVTTTDRFSQSSAALLVNGYYDFGIFAGLTPYVGAGVGVARVQSDTLTRDINGLATYTFASRTRYSLAAAAMAGFSVDIGHGLQADIGYRFNWIDRGRSGVESTGALAGPVNIGDSSSHQIRVGLKYFIN